MIKYGCINPKILKTLSLLGHGDKILISDGNYPLETKTVCNAKVYLGLTAGVPTVTQVLEVILSEINVEKAETMNSDDGSVPEMLGDFETLLPEVEMVSIDRFDFYDECCKQNVKLAISTGEKRLYANILLTVGCA